MGETCKAAEGGSLFFWKNVINIKQNDRQKGSLFFGEY